MSDALPSQNDPRTPAELRGVLARGRRVRIIQQIPRLSGSQQTEVIGVVLSSEPQKSGSWFAHGKDNKVWVHRVKLEKDDGEIAYINLDNYSVIEDASVA
ncbi:MAG: hypothetical protein AAF108_00805 [Planctomycetota bacterium]